MTVESPRGRVLWYLGASLLALIFFFPLLLAFMNLFKANPEIVADFGAWTRGDALANAWTNLSQAWIETNFPLAFLNTLIIAVGAISGLVVMSSMAAYVMVRYNTKIAWVLFLLFAFAMIVPFQAIMMPLVRTARDFGALSNLGGIILIYMALGAPFSIFLYHGFIKTIPLELEEAAMIEGASDLRIFFRLILPLLQPITATLIILHSLWIWNDFLLPLLILQRPEVRTLQLAVNSFFGVFGTEYGKALAALFLASVPMVLLYAFLQRYIIRGVAAGSIK